MSNNAGVKYDSDRGLEIRGLQPKLDGRIRGTIANLVRLSDLFASVIKHPSDAEANGLSEVLNSLSNGQLKFSYHSLSDNRGVLTNIINNALMDAHPSEFYTPLLYLPDGAVYLAKTNAPAIETTEIPNQVIAKIKNLCAERLKLKTTGFSRDGKGFKFGEFYWLFFDIIELMGVSIEAACKLITSSKASSAKKRSDSLVSFQKDGDLPGELNLEFPEDYRIDRLAEFGDILCRGIWNKWQERLSNSQKELPKAKRQSPPELDLTQKLAEHLGLSDQIPALKAIQSLKKTGGVPLDWYYLAAQYFERNKGLDETQVRAVLTDMVECAVTLIKPIAEKFKIPDGWNDLRTYVSRIVSLPDGGSCQTRNRSFFTRIGAVQCGKNHRERTRKCLCDVEFGLHCDRTNGGGDFIYSPSLQQPPNFV
jgi:CRISPR-associated protein Csc3